MHLDVHVEEPSMEIVLKCLLPQILSSNVTFKILTYQSKPDMLRKLPKRLKAYSRRVVNEDLRILVLIDEDRQDCQILKDQLESMSLSVGLQTKTASMGQGPVYVVNRIVIEELEAWFFGDEEALKKAFPKIQNVQLSKKKRYRDPDSITGGTWESLHSVLKNHGYCKDIYPKRHVARRVAQYMQIGSNRSLSFQHFVQGVKSLSP